jgi:hypothetical protein
MQSEGKMRFRGEEWLNRHAKPKIRIIRVQLKLHAV